MMDVLGNLLSNLARLLVARGILFPAFAEEMKAHYVRAASDASEGKVTDSRLSVATGLQRRDVARLRDFQAKPPRPNHLTRLVARWRTDPVYSKDGTPNPLPRTAPSPSFEDLAREIRRDVHPRTMLDTLLATGTIELVDDDQTVRLLAASYQPLAGSEEQLDYLSANVGDHLATATSNVIGAVPQRFERSVHYTRLTEAQIKELEATYAAGQMALLERLSQMAAGMKAGNGNDEDGWQPDADTRFRAGGFFFAENGHEDEK